MKSFTKTITIIALFFSLTAISQEKKTIGRTYPIIEKNAIEQVKEDAKKINVEELYSKKRKTFIEDIRDSSLTKATENKVRKHIPWGYAPEDIKDKDGNIIYKKGFKFNPLKYVTMTYRVIVIDEEHLSWLTEKLRPSDRVLLNSGNLPKAKETLNHSVFIIDDMTKKKLSLEKTPSIIKQEKDVLIINEVYVEVTK